MPMPMPAPTPPAMTSVSPVLPVAPDAGPKVAAPEPPPPLPQAGILTAGDYDDQLNPGMYAAYIKRHPTQVASQALPYPDTLGRITIWARDKAGKPAALAKVVVNRGDDAALVMTTAADGTVALYPNLDRLPERFTVTASPLSGGPEASADVVLAKLKGKRRVEITLSTPSQPIRKLDLLLVVDATGSMADEMTYLQSELISILGGLDGIAPGVDIRVGLIVYRDKGDEYVVRDFAFTGDIKALQAEFAKQRANGGGDEPEAMDQAMARALSYDWRPDAAKVLLLVADAPPHDADIAATWGSAVQARWRQIHILPVAASGVNPTAEFQMRAMAAMTQSRYVFLTDDSGVGRPHKTPEVNCYQVSRLNGLLTRTLGSLISGKRIEATPDQVIRTVGNYDKGVCKAGQAG